MQNIGQGAEALLKREGFKLIKERVRKGYRISALDDKLRVRRTELESRLLNEARRAGVPTPQVISVEGARLEMEWIDGKTVKDSLDAKNCDELGHKIGSAVAKLHSYDIIHGDLTTSNIIVKSGVLYLIDFGLGFQSSRTEDKAVDLYLLRCVIESTHFYLLNDFWKAIVDGYQKNYAQADKVIKTLAGIEKRGRYKHK